MNSTSSVDIMDRERRDHVKFSTLQLRNGLKLLSSMKVGA